MLDTGTVKKITDFVNTKPRTIQEISQCIDKNWRTADRYVERIAQETGMLAVRTFRKGSRGALKIVYFSNVERIASTEFQERLLQRIMLGRKKEDFSPFDIYQYVDPQKRRAFLEVQKEEFAKIEQDVVSLFRSAQQVIMIFSGNLSWANVMQGKTKVIDVLAEIADAKIPIKIVTRVDIASVSNLAKVQQINERLGREAIEIRHVEQPLRCVLVDTRQVRFKETKNPEHYRGSELKEKTFIFYDIYDQEWVEWMQKVFWKMFSTGIPAAKRVETLESIQQICHVGSKKYC